MTPVDLVLLHAPSVYDFREKAILYGPVADLIPSSSMFEMYPIVLQVKGGGLGGIFGQADSVYRTKRGAEKTLFQLTIVLVVLFIVISIVALRVGR